MNSQHDRNFERFLSVLQKAIAGVPKTDFNGPLSNGEYVIDFYESVRILFYPHLKQNNGKTVMDFICIPQPDRYPLQNNYFINELMQGVLPHANYLYGDSTIERSLSYTSCIRFSLDQSIIEEIPKFLEIIDFINDNIHTILKKQEELDSL